MYVCMYRCKQRYRNTIIATYFLWAWHSFHARAVGPRACRSHSAERRQRLGRLRAQQPKGVVARRGDIGGRFIDSG